MRKQPTKRRNPTPVLLGSYSNPTGVLLRCYSAPTRVVSGKTPRKWAISANSKIEKSFRSQWQDEPVRWPSRNRKMRNGRPHRSHIPVADFPVFPLRASRLCVKTLPTLSRKARGQGGGKMLFRGQNATNSATSRASPRTRSVLPLAALRACIYGVDSVFPLELRACMRGVRAFFFPSLTRRAGSSEARRTGLNFPQSSRFTTTLPKGQTQFKQTAHLVRLIVNGRTVFFRGKL